MDNIFIKYIKEGRIRTLDDLKRSYRQIVMKTHPDAVGSDRLVDEYIECRSHYEEARRVIREVDNGPEGTPGEESRDYRLLFYRELYKLERIDRPYAFNKHYNTREEIERTKQRACEYFGKWREDRIELYRRANRIYDQIKQEKPRGPYRKYALLFNLSPVFHNIVSYQLTGLQFYRKQIRQNFAGVMHRLEERRFYSLIEYIQFLVRDMENGPAMGEPN